MTNLANHRGYTSVHHYLESLHCKNEEEEKSDKKVDYKDEGKADKTEVNQIKVESVTETEMKVEKTEVNQNGLKSEPEVMVQIKEEENSQNTSKPEVTNQNELKSDMKVDYKDEGKADKTEVNQNKVESEMKVEKIEVNQNGLKSEPEVMVQIKEEPIYMVYNVYDNSDKNSKMILKFKKVEESLKEENHFDEVH